MPIEILMPALSPTMTEGTLSNWLVKEGDEITSGMVLAEIETDKATMEVEAVDEGRMGKILVAAGTEGVAVNTPIALLLEEGEDASALDKAKPAAAPAPAEASAPAAAPAPAAAAAPAPAVAPVASGPVKTPAPAGDRIIASPLAKRMAANEGLDLSGLSGSGPHGRIVKRDVEEALASGGAKAAPAAKPADKAPAAAPAAAAPAGAPVTAMKGLTLDDPIIQMLPEFDAVPNSGMRKIIAKRLTESARDIPHFNLQIDVELTGLMALRKQLNERPGADYKLSVNDLIIKATALALTRVPDANVAYTEGAILKFKRVDMAIAVAIDGGLITPIIKDCAAKGLATISKEAKELAGKAREGKLKPEEYQGGTFSISNLGMFGIKGFTSIINPPQGAILSVGAGEDRAVVKNGALAIANMLTLNLAVDHRCIDGAVGAAFLKELKSLIEDPIALML